MDFKKIMGIVIIILGVLTGLIHFNILPTIQEIDIVLVAISIFVLHELHALILNLSHDGNKVIGASVPLFFIITAALYFIKDFLPEIISSNLLLMISIIMIVEGLYRLH